MLLPIVFRHDWNYLLAVLCVCYLFFYLVIDWNFLLIVLKALAICKLVCTLARNYFWSRANLFRSVRFCQIFARSVKHLRAKLKHWPRVSHGSLHFLARPEKLSRVELNFFVQPRKVPHAKLCVSTITFSVCFDCLRPERCILWVCYCSLLVNSLEQWHIASLKACPRPLTESHLTYLLFDILMLVNTLRRMDHNLWPFEPINQITRALVNNIIFCFILPRLGFSAMLA